MLKKYLKKPLEINIYLTQLELSMTPVRRYAGPVRRDRLMCVCLYVCLQTYNRA
jgi:hypothetical protein